MASRAASGKAIQWVAANVPELVGGSADLASSNNTDIADGGDVVPGDFSGRNLHFGVREHAMGAIVNGLALHGFRAFGGTFLTFSDYMRGAVRLSALMKLPLDLGLDPRLDRARLRRADAPAGRAHPRAAGDAEPVGDPPGGRQ